MATTKLKPTDIDKIFALAGLPSRNTKKTDTAGVCYYNIDNKDNKENKENTEDPLDLSSLDTEANASLRSNEVITSHEQVQRRSSQEEESLDSKGGRVKAETPANPLATEDPALTPSMVDRCLLTFYDNGEQPKGSKKQRYKLGITINPIEAPGDRWEFIGNCNKDRRIFVRNLPEKNRSQTIQFVDEMRTRCKSQYSSYPLIGKVHANAKWNEGQESMSQKEDGCAVAVFWTGSHWRATIMLWDYIIETDLFSHDLSANQKRKNVKAVSGIIYGPNSTTKLADASKRKPTFRQMRSN
jgi:hypothetical protein